MGSSKDDSGIDDVIRGAHKALVARAFVALSIPDSLGAQPMSLADLASATKADPAPLNRLLRGAVAAGLCAESSGRYELTATGMALQSGAPGNAAEWLMLTTAPWIVAAWQELAEAVRSGRASFPQVHDKDFWEYVAEHPTEAGAFAAAMTSGAAARAEDLFSALNWSAGAVVVDVGGGQGLLMARLLSLAPHLRGIVADRAEVVTSPAQLAIDLGSRMTMVANDFFREVPSGGDVYVLSRILHDWPDREAITILRCCHVAMKKGSRLCLLEQVAPESSQCTQEEKFDLASKDLNMLVLVGGQERTLREYTRLLAAADLQVFAVHQGATCDVIEAGPVVNA